MEDKKEEKVQRPTRHQLLPLPYPPVSGFSCSTVDAREEVQVRTGAQGMEGQGTPQRLGGAPGRQRRLERL